MKTKKNPTAKKEYLSVDFEVKQILEEDTEFFIFEGLASTFGNIDLVDDIVMPGAFKESLETRTPVILWQHNSHEPIGVPLEIREIDAGLFLKAKLPRADTLVSGRIIPQIKIKSITKMSIGFRVKEFSIDEEGVRTLEKVDLMEISLVTFPANPLASVTDFKCLDIDDVKEIKTCRQFEKALRDSGAFSNKAATLLASNFQGELDDQQPETDEDLESLKLLSKRIEDSEISAHIKSMSQKLEN